MPARSKFTKPRRDTILQAIRDGKSQPAAARKAGVSEQAIRNWLKEGQQEGCKKEYATFYQGFQEALQEAQDKWEEQFEKGDVQITVETITTPDGQTITKRRQTITRKADHAWKWLQARFPDEYGIDSVGASDDKEDESTPHPLGHIVGKKGIE